MKPEEQALVPDFFRPAVKEATRIITKPKEGDEDLLLTLAESDSWTHLKAIIEGTINELSDQTKKKVNKAKTMEEVGLRYLIRDIATDSMQGIVDVVDLRKKAKDAELAAK